MERIRDARRGAAPVPVPVPAMGNALPRGRQRNGSARDSPGSRSDEDGSVELQEARLRDHRVTTKSGDRDGLNRSRRRIESLVDGSNRKDDGGDGSTDESIDDEDDDEDPALAASVASMPSSSPNHHLKKCFLAKAVTRRRVAEKVIAFSVPRKARSGGSRGGGSNTGESISRQLSMSPVAGVQVSPVSPSTSNVSARKKMRPIGAKNRPPKVSKTSPVPETEIEMEIAEVLYGMTRQFLCSPKEETLLKAVEKPSLRDAPYQSSAVLPNSNPVATAPKRKRPRSYNLEDEDSSKFAISDAPAASLADKIEAKEEISSPKLEKTETDIEQGGGCINGGGSEPLSPVPLQDSVKLVSKPVDNQELLQPESLGQVGSVMEEEVALTVKEAPANAGSGLEDSVTTRMESAASTVFLPPAENSNIEKIDLMTLPCVKSLPEISIDMVEQAAVENPSVAISKIMPKKEVVNEEKNTERSLKEGEVVELTVKKTKPVEEEMILDRQEDVDKVGAEMQQVQKQPAKTGRNESEAEKAVQSGCLPGPMKITNLPRGLPPIGYIGQVPPSLPAASTNGGSASNVQPLGFPLPHQPQPKRCAIHCYIAQKIKYHKQFARINHFWPGSPVSVPPTEIAGIGNPLQGTSSWRNLSSSQEKVSGPTLVDNTSKDKSTPSLLMNAAQRTRHVLQQASQQASSNNVSAPVFVFPLNHQQPVSTSLSEDLKPTNAAGKAASSSGSTNSVVESAVSSVSTASVNFNYANLPANDVQYLTMVQSSGYPFPVPTHVGVPPPYRGSHHPGMPMPFFNGSFYSPPVIHPSQLQLQQQQQQQKPQCQPLAVQLGTQNSVIANGPSSVKHQQQQRLQGCSSNDGGGISNGPSKERPKPTHCSPPILLHQHETKTSNSDRNCTADSSNSHTQESLYAHNYTMPVHPQNFTVMFPDALNGGSQGEKQKQQSSKGGMEHNQSQAFAMSFAAFNSAGVSPAGLDFSSVAQNHAVFQCLPEAPLRLIQHKTHQSRDESKPSGGLINSAASSEDERKMAGKASTTNSLTYSFSRQDNEPSSLSTVLGNTVLDSSIQASNSVSSSGNGIRFSHSGAMPPVSANATNSHSHQQHLLQLQKQQHQLPSHVKSVSSTADVYSALGKFPNGMPLYPQVPTQGTNPSPWKTATKTGTSPISSSQASTPSAKILGQQQSWMQFGIPAPSHMQISFGGQTNHTAISKSTGDGPKICAGPNALPLSSEMIKGVSVKPQQQSFQQTQSFFSESHPKRQSDQQLLQQSSFAVSSSPAMISYCSPSIPYSGATSNSGQAVSAAAMAASNHKRLPPPGFLHGTPHLLMSAAIPYIHPMPTVPVNSAEQKPAAGK